MAGITLEQAQAQLDAWYEASLKVAQSQEYAIGDRRLTRADAKEIAANVKFWEARVNKLTRGGLSMKGATPV